jgi:hypothetical protein
MRCTVGVVGFKQTSVQTGRRVTNVLVSRIVVETQTIDGDSPVDENHRHSLV